VDSVIDFTNLQDRGTEYYVNLALENINYVGRYLAIGDSIGSKAILNVPYIRENKDRIKAWGINVQPEACGHWEHMDISLMDAHRITYESGRMDVVLCCMMLEHDPEFWLTLSEVRRVLKPGGAFLLAVPTFLHASNGDSVACYREHGEDYYRFSQRAISKVLMKGFNRLQLILYQDPPRALCYGFKEEQ
jgi:SAM-dependent methyltransferase